MHDLVRNHPAIKTSQERLDTAHRHRTRLLEHSARIDAENRRAVREHRLALQRALDEHTPLPANPQTQPPALGYETALNEVIAAENQQKNELRRYASELLDLLAGREAELLLAVRPHVEALDRLQAELEELATTADLIPQQNRPDRSRRVTAETILAAVRNNASFVRPGQAAFLATERL